jgi:pimeloyl-ACP methyl ester carboxylesterase
VREAASGGHGVEGHRGRSSSEAIDAVEAAMARLFALGRAQVSTAFVDVGGTRVHHLETGSGPPLVLLHGAGGGGANWYRVFDAFAERFRVLAPDLPGFGLSGSTRIEAPLGVAGARFLENWLDRLSISRADLVATSFGGLIALRLAQRAPARVRRLILLNSVGLGRDLPWLVRLATVRGTGVALRPSRAGMRWLFRLLLTSERGGLGDHEEALVDYLWRSAAAGEPREMARLLRLFGGVRGQHEVLSTTELEELSVPTLLVWGERDRFLPVAHARRAAACIPGARLRILRGAGHSPNWETPDLFLAAALPFLGP